jgi:hypothetical protein
MPGKQPRSWRLNGKVEVSADVIITTPLVWKSFIGQPLKNVVAWLSKFGQAEVERI